MEQEAYEKLTVQWFNDAKVESTDGYDCPRCGNKLMYAEWDEAEKRVRRYVCPCQSLRVARTQIKRAGLERLLDSDAMATFQAKEPWQKRMLETAQSYIHAPEGWLVLSGQSGCGKTHLCTAAYVQLIHKGLRGQFMAWRDRIGTLKSVDIPREDIERELTGYKQAQLLCIDDLLKCGDGQPTRADKDIAFEILDARYRAKLPTILSTELSLPQLEQLDEAIAGRIHEMAAGRIVSVKRDRFRNLRLRS